MHKITNINITDKTAHCSICGLVKVKIRGLKKDGSIRGECQTVFRKYNKKYKNGDVAQIYNRKRQGMKVDEEIIKKYNEEKFCHCCGQKRPRNNKEFHIDHCHKTGKVRGFLCRKCNLAIGLFHDSEEELQKAIEYLRKSN